MNEKDKRLMLDLGDAATVAVEDTLRKNLSRKRLSKAQAMQLVRIVATVIDLRRGVIAENIHRGD